MFIMNHYKRFILLLLLCVVALSSCGSDKVIPVFNGDNAFNYLIAQTEFGPRNPGSTGHQQGLEHLIRVQPELVGGFTTEIVHRLAAFVLVQAE